MKLRKIFPIIGLVFFATSASAYRIAVLSDVHVTPHNANDTILRQAVDEINATSGIDIVVLDGDLTNEGSDAQLHNIKSILDNIKQPLYVLPGNHENNWSQSATRTFNEIWGNDRFVTTTDSLVIIGINCGPFMKMGDGHIKQEDLHWLDATLANNVKDGKHVVSFNHYPLQDDLDNYQAYAEILHRYPTIIHVNGHYHVNRPYQCGDIPCMMVRALDCRNKDYGYTLMDVTPDSIIFYQKRLNTPAERIHAYGITTPRPDLTWAVTTLTDTLVNVNGKNMAINRLVADSASIFTRLGIDENNVYYGTSLGDAKAVNKVSGNEVWTRVTGASLFARPSASDTIVAIPCADDALRFVDTRTGSAYSIVPSEGPYVADGIIVNDRLYQGGYKKMECYDINTGELLWRNSSLANYCQASPVVDGDDLIFGAWDTYLYCLNKNDGSLRWKWNNGKSANMLGPGNCVPVVTSDKVIIVAPDRYMTAIDRSTGKTIWRNKDHKYRESLGVSEDGTRAYAKTMDGELVAVDLTTPDFNELWTVDLGFGYEHAPCIVAERDGIIYAGSRRGHIAMVTPDGKNVTNIKLGSSEVNGIDLDPTSSDVYLSLIEGTIYRITPKE